jgi:hypothetical protein
VAKTKAKTVSTGDEILRLMVFDEPDPKHAKSFLAFEQEFDLFLQTYQEEGWRTVVFDSVDSFELNARKLEQYTLNVGSKDPRQWYGGSTSKVEETICMRLAHLRCNVVVITHIDDSKMSIHGHQLIGPSGPGKQAKGMGRFFGEVYRSYATKAEGTRVYQLQTSVDDVAAAKTHINAPDPCYPDYESLWANWNGDKRPDIKILSYGDFGAGKSCFAATFPKPMKVYFFDPLGGNEFSYLNIGIPGEMQSFDVGAATINYIPVFERVES